MPPSGEVLVTPVGGGKLTVDRVTIEFPAGAVDTNVLVRLDVLNAIPHPPGPLKLAYAFEAKALHPDTRAESRVPFARPAQVTLEYSGLAMTQIRERNLALYSYDENEKQWNLLPSRLDRRNKKVTGQVAHFSTIAGGGNPLWEPSSPPTLDGFQVDLMTGSGTYRYPIELPPGTGGLTPRLELTYTSSIMDVMNNIWLQQGGGDNDSPGVQASWVGAGWNLNVGYVNSDSTGYPTHLCINGSSHKLVRTPGWPPEYRTERNQFWKVLLRTSGGQNRSGYYVEAWDKEGTYYRFGYDMDSECHDGDWPYRYVLDRVEDTRGNYLTFHYYTIQKTTWDSSNQYDQQVYLDYILYTANSQTGFSPQWRIEFNRSASGQRKDVKKTEFQYWNEYYLDSIDVRKADGSMVRKYVFGYSYGYPWWYQNESNQQQKGETKLLLRSITVCDTGATPGYSNGTPSGNTLPATTFSYHESGDTDPNPKNNLWMATGDNGYGGKVTYTYVNNVLTEEPRQQLWYHTRVTDKTLEDGLGGSASYTYQYGTLRQRDVSFWGHVWTKEVDAAGHWATHYFYVRHYDNLPDTPDPDQNNKLGQDIRVMRGKRWKLERGGSGSGSWTSKEEYDWQYRKTGDLSGEPDCWFVYLASLDSYLDSKHKRVEYVYDTYGDPNYYDGYGNVKEEYHWGDMAGDGSERRSIHRRFNPNTTAWIVGKVAWENVYATITGNVGGPNLKTQTIYYYDGQNDYTLPPIKGLVTKMERGVTGQLIVTTQYTYDAYGNRTSVTNPNNRTTDTSYETTYNTYPQTITYPSVGGQPRMTESYVYDPRWGKLTSVTDPNGQATSYEYDTFGRLTKVIRPGDSSTDPTERHAYFDSQSPFKVETQRRKNASGGAGQYHYTRVFYDGLGREVQRYADGVSGHVCVNTYYDNRGLKRRESVPHFVSGTGSFLQTDWNTWYNQGSSTPGTDYAYDALRRPTQVTNPDNTQRSTSYDGWDTTVIDENSHKKVQKMDAFGRLVAVEEYTGTGPYSLYATTAYEYDVLDNLTKVTDNASNVNTITYDSLSRKTGMTDPDMGSWSYGYDAVGNLVQQTDAENQVITFNYDELNRMTHKYYPAAWVDKPLTTSHCPGVYDLMELRAAIDVDRLAAAVSPFPYPWTDQTIIAGRDVTVRAVHFTEMREQAVQGLWTAAGMGTVPQFNRGPIVAGSRTISLQDPEDLRGWLDQYEAANWAVQNWKRGRAVYRYDDYSDGQARGYPKGRRTEMWDVSGRTRWTYDERGRITVEERWIDGQLYTTQWAYDAMDRVTSITYPDGEVVSYGYNDQLLLASMAGAASYITGMSYNALGKPTQLSLGNGRVTDYQYCGVEWLGKVPYGALAWLKTTKSGYPNLQDLQYTYDNVGNPTQIHDPRNGETINYSYDDLDRLISASAPINGSYSYNQIGNLLSKTEGGVTYNLDYSTTTHKHAPNGVNGVPYTYDKNGNLTSRSGVDYRYDPENRLVKVSQGAQYVARFAYDGDGKRVKRVDNYGTIHYIGPHYERNVGNGQDTTEVITKLYYAQLGPYRRLIAVNRAGTLYYVHTEHLGGTNILSDSSGNEVGALRYHSYGQGRVQTGSVPTDRRFTGQILDLSSGLYHYGARYYDADLGRFVQPDTVVPEPGNPQALNRYSYTLNNPLRYTDPTGFDPFTWEDLWYRARGYEPVGGEWVYTGRYAAVITSPEQATKVAAGAPYVLLMVGGVGTGGYERRLGEVANRLLLVLRAPRDEVVAFHISYAEGLEDWALPPLPSYSAAVERGAEIVGRTAYLLASSGSRVVAVGHSRGAEVVSRAEHGHYGKFISESAVLAEPVTSLYRWTEVEGQHRITPALDPLSSPRALALSLLGPTGPAFGLATTLGPLSRSVGHGSVLNDAMAVNIAELLAPAATGW
jgi:RHS repeat-associated protein